MVVFQSDRIDFVSVSEALVDDYLIMMNDPGVQRMIAHEPRVYDREGELAWIQENLADGTMLFSMLERATGRFIGNTDLREFDAGRAVLGISITPAMQDRGFGTEAVERMVQYGFETLGLDAVELKVYAHNPRARHVYEKLGFKVVSTGEPGADGIVDICMRRGRDIP